jgi:3-isopropylmalate dehydratase small subunit
MEDIDAGFVKKAKPGDIIVAGKNFGCGSSREHAPIAIKACGISCVIASSFARIFYRNALNIGLPILESEKASKELKEGDRIEIDLDKGSITNLSTLKRYNSIPFPSFLQEIIKAGGLLAYAKKKKR